MTLIYTVGTKSYQVKRTARGRFVYWNSANRRWMIVAERKVTEIKPYVEKPAYTGLIPPLNP